MEALKALINEVVKAREWAKEATERRTSEYQKWVEANQSLLDHEKFLKEACLEAEANLRDMALQSYAQTGNKTVAPGVGIRVMTKLNYDAKEAMAWAMEHSLALTLDKKAFEAIAKTTPLGFVVSTEEPIATIAQDLSKIA